MQIHQCPVQYYFDNVNLSTGTGGAIKSPIQDYVHVRIQYCNFHSLTITESTGLVVSYQNGSVQYCIFDTCSVMSPTRVYDDDDAAGTSLHGRSGSLIFTKRTTNIGFVVDSCMSVGTLSPTEYCVLGTLEPTNSLFDKDPMQMVTPVPSYTPSIVFDFLSTYLCNYVKPLDRTPSSSPVPPSPEITPIDSPIFTPFQSPESTPYQTPEITPMNTFVMTPQISSAVSNYVTPEQTQVPPQTPDVPEPSNKLTIGQTVGITLGTIIGVPLVASVVYTSVKFLKKRQVAPADDIQESCEVSDYSYVDTSEEDQ